MNSYFQATGRPWLSSGAKQLQYSWLRSLWTRLKLAAFPDVKPGLEALKKRGLRLAILSNGEPKMLQAAAISAGINSLLDGIISVEEANIF